MKIGFVPLLLVLCWLSFSFPCYAEEYSSSSSYLSEGKAGTTPKVEYKIVEEEQPYKPIKHSALYWIFYGGPIKAPLITVVWFITNIPTFLIAVGTFTLDAVSFFRGGSSGSAHWSTTRKFYVPWRRVFDNFLP